MNRSIKKHLTYYVLINVSSYKVILETHRFVYKQSNSFVYIYICNILSPIVRLCPINLKIGILYQKENTLRKIAF